MRPGEPTKEVWQHSLARWLLASPASPPSQRSPVRSPYFSAADRVGRDQRFLSISPPIWQLLPSFCCCSSPCARLLMALPIREIFRRGTRGNPLSLREGSIRPPRPVPCAKPLSF